MAFHEVRFPTDISLRSTGGPSRRTEIVALGSGHEERNQRWADSRRSYDAGYGIKTLDDLYDVVEFFEERRGRLYGFRWKDRTDCKSGKPQASVTMLDELIGIGDGANSDFQLKKTYGSSFSPYSRDIKKPVSGTVLLAVNGVLQDEGVSGDYTIDYTTGAVTFQIGSIPPDTLQVTAGFEFDVPVRFDSDELRVNVDGFLHGQIPSIPLVELLL